MFAFDKQTIIKGRYGHKHGIILSLFHLFKQLFIHSYTRVLSPICRSVLHASCSPAFIMTQAGSGRRDGMEEEDHIEKLQPGHNLLVNCILLIVDFHHGHNKNKYHIKVLIKISNFHFSLFGCSVQNIFD